MLQYKKQCGFLCLIYSWVVQVNAGKIHGMATVCMGTLQPPLIWVVYHRESPTDVGTNSGPGKKGGPEAF